MTNMAKAGILEETKYIEAILEEPKLFQWNDIQYNK